MAPTFVRLLKDGDPETGMQSSNLIGPDAFTGDDKTELIHDFLNRKTRRYPPACGNARRAAKKSSIIR